MSSSMGLTASDLAKISGTGNRTSGHGLALLLSLHAGLILAFVGFVFVLYGRRRREASAVFRLHNPNPKTVSGPSIGLKGKKLPWKGGGNCETVSPPRPALNFTRDVVVETQNADGTSMISHPRDSMLVGGGGSMFSTNSSTQSIPRRHDLAVNTDAPVQGANRRDSHRSHGAVWTTEYHPSPTYSDFFEFEESYQGPQDIRMSVQRFPDSAPSSGSRPYPEPLPSSHGSASFHVGDHDASRPPVPSLPESVGSVADVQNPDARSLAKREKKPSKAVARATQQLSDTISQMNDNSYGMRLSEDVGGDFTTYHQQYPARV